MCACSSIVLKFFADDWSSMHHVWRARERRGAMSKCRSKIHNTLGNFLYGNRLQQLETPHWAHAYTHYQPFLQYVRATFSQSRRLFWPPCRILFIKQRKNTWVTGEDHRYFSAQMSRRMLSTFVQLGREYSAYWIPYLVATIDNSRNLLAAASGF